MLDEMETKSIQEHAGKDGKVILYRHSTGQSQNVFPVDAREMLGTGEWFLDPPSRKGKASVPSPAQPPRDAEISRSHGRRLESLPLSQLRFICRQGGIEGGAIGGMKKAKLIELIREKDLDGAGQPAD